MTGAARKSFWAAYKARKGCADCGDRASVLQFDHLPEHTKLFTIANALGRTRIYSDADIAAEVAKCEVVCNSCHVIRTRHRRMVRKWMAGLV